MFLSRTCFSNYFANSNLLSWFSSTAMIHRFLTIRTQQSSPERSARDGPSRGRPIHWRAPSRLSPTPAFHRIQADERPSVGKGPAEGGSL